jgi:hypothetical protein
MQVLHTPDPRRAEGRPAVADSLASLRRPSGRWVGRCSARRKRTKESDFAARESLQRSLGAARFDFSWSIRKKGSPRVRAFGVASGGQAVPGDRFDEEESRAKTQRAQRKNAKKKATERERIIAKARKRENAKQENQKRVFLARVYDVICLPFVFPLFRAFAMILSLSVAFFFAFFLCALCVFARDSSSSNTTLSRTDDGHSGKC